MLPHVSSPPLFVGRTPELSALTERLDAAANGHGGVALLAGEPGIGKTRLTEELAAGAMNGGVQVLWGRCYEGEGAQTFWPWVQVLREAINSRDLAAVRAGLGADAVVLAALIPKLRDGDPAGPAARAETAEERFRLFAAVSAFLTTTAARTPLLIIVDDLHWADASSLLLFEFLAREVAAAPILLVGAYRDSEALAEHPLSRTLGRLARLPHGVRLPLRGLAAAEVAAVIADIAGVAASAATAAAVSDATEGNPFFVGEITRFQSGGDGLVGGAVLTLPPGLREVIGLRLAELSPGCGRVLTLAAVIGREFPLRALEQASEGLGDHALAALEEAEAARIIAPVAMLGCYRIAHALIRETLYDAIPSVRQARLHRQIGEALEQLWDGEAEHLAELAWHFTRAAPVGDAGRAVAYARKAGDLALALLAYEEGVRCYQMALAAVNLDLRASGPLRAELLLALGEAHRLAGETESGEKAYWRAVELARTAHGHSASDATATLLARAAVGIGRLTLSVQPPEQHLADLREEALAAVGPADSLLRVQLLGQMASDLHFADERRRQALSSEAVAVARRLGDPRALAVALITQHNALRGPDEQERQLATATEALHLAAAADDAALTLLAYRLRVVDHTEIGDFAAFEQDRQAHERLARRTRDPYHLWLAMLWRAMQAQMAGQWPAALSLAAEAFALGQRAEADLAELYHALQIAAVRQEHGPIAEGIAVLREIPARYPMLDGLDAVLAGLFVDAGDEHDARRIYESSALGALQHPGNDDAPASGSTIGRRRSGHWLLTTPHDALVASALGDPIGAATLYALLRPHAHRVVMASPGAVCYGSVSFYLGVLATTLLHEQPALARPPGEHGAASPTWDDAVRHFEDALATNDRIEALVWLARTRHAYALLLLNAVRIAPARGGERPARAELLPRAAELLRQATEDAIGLGLERLSAQIARARAELDALSPATTATPAPLPAAAPDGLTAREMDVLRLLATGASNKQIAEALYLSVATVHGHTMSIYGKIGATGHATGRAAAAAYAVRHGITPPDED